MKLLLVEDDAEYAAGLGDELRALDDAVTVVDGGKAAMDAVQATMFDAVILDRMLPLLPTLLRSSRTCGARRILPLAVIRGIWGHG